MEEKIVVVFRATGDAPILKNNKVKVRGATANEFIPRSATRVVYTPSRDTTSMCRAPGPAPPPHQKPLRGQFTALSPPPPQISGEKPFREVVAFLNKSLGISIFAYLNGAFAPSLDELVGVLSKSHGVSGQLIVNYASTPAWG